MYLTDRVDCLSDKSQFNGLDSLRETFGARFPKPRVAGSSPAGGASCILAMPHCRSYPAVGGTAALALRVNAPGTPIYGDARDFRWIANSGDSAESVSWTHWQRSAGVYT